MQLNENSQGTFIDVKRFKPETHVEDAVHTALGLAQGRPLNAGHLLEAALLVSRANSSAAFSMWASFFPPVEMSKAVEYTPEVNLSAVPINEFLAVGFRIAEPFLLKVNSIWGRDYITLALLTVGDPSLDEISAAARSSIEELQDKWFLFVTTDETHLDSELWARWWREAGVPLPGERIKQSAPEKTGPETQTGTYLLTWDPQRHTVDSLTEAVRELEQKGTVVQSWSVGSHGLSRGDRVFFMRHGEDMPGLIGAGYVVGEVREDSHWDRTKPTDWTAYFADVRWDVLRLLPLIPLEDLIKKTGEDNLWTTQGSGLPIPQGVAERLEIIWKEAVSLGPSTHIATDIWTLDDTLGYRSYAYAIYRFMIHEQTRAPLTISIQAPWGGGKTSLMRMIQKLLDPEALNKWKEDPGRAQSDLTIKGALHEIDEWMRSDAKKGLPMVPAKKSRKLLTVWFNAWKYESTNQIWAGLADAVMKQVAERLPLVEKERFWLRLNLRRVDAEKIRRHIYERILNYTWRSARGWILGSGLLLLASIVVTVMGWVTEQKTALSAGWFGIGSSALISFVSGVNKYFAAKKDVEKEPASISLSKYLDIPDYNKELGFVHNVEADLRRVFASVPEQHRPVVIFIDDLDRCSPAKVAQVLEAVNLFLAGDFPYCFFLLGMDSEMVAAALQAAHKDMLACLPADAGIPLGWRFMDKFVQLPFLIPLPEGNDVARYARSLFSLNHDPILEPVMQQAIERAQSIQSKSDVAHEMAELQTRHNLDEAQRIYLQEKLETQVVERVLDKGIETFTDNNPEIRRVISAATSYFHGNPRELKRFVNVFRFHYFVWWARRAQDLEIPTLDQLLRWTVLSMKWPETVRWLRRGGGTDWCVQTVGGEKCNRVPTQTSRLKLIEGISGMATDLRSWQDQALEVLRLTPKDAPWLNEAQLLSFFQDEHTQYPEGKRLSDGEGKGLW